MTLRRPFAGAAAALAALTLAACGTSGTPDAAAPADGGPLTVVASTNVYGSIAEAVGGDRVTVESLITDPAADPHSYESTPSDAATIAGASIVIFNGGGYDEFVPQLLEAAGGEHSVIDVAQLAGLPAEEHGAHTAAEEHGAADEHGEFNEHFWYSLPTMRDVAARLATELSAVDAANAAVYSANAERFGTEIDGLVERTEAIGASVPGARVAVTEPVPGYLIETAGLTNATPAEFSEAIEEDTDPPAAVLQETLALFTPGAADPIRALILNGQTQTPTTDQVREAAAAVGVPVVEVTETLPADQADYLTWMSAQIDALSAALNPV